MVIKSCFMRGRKRGSLSLTDKRSLAEHLRHRIVMFHGLLANEVTIMNFAEATVHVSPTCGRSSTLRNDVFFRRYVTTN